MFVLGMLLMAIGAILVLSIVGLLPGIAFVATGWWLIILALVRRYNPDGNN